MYEVTPLSLGGNPRRKANENDYLVKCRVDNETVVFVPINGAERRALHNAGQMELETFKIYSSVLTVVLPIPMTPTCFF